MRYSKQRETVYLTLKSMCSHPDAAQIYKLVREKIPNVSLGTVYRNLGELCQAGLVHRVSVENSAERFDARTDQHAHFVCNCCNGVTDVSMEDIMVQRKLQGVTNCKVVLYGTCDQCTSKKQKKEIITMKKWVCTVCGYVHEGEQPPEECPLCGVGADQFEETEE